MACGRDSSGAVALQLPLRAQLVQEILLVSVLALGVGVVELLAQERHAPWASADAVGCAAVAVGYGDGLPKVASASAPSVGGLTHKGEFGAVIGAMIDVVLNRLPPAVINNCETTWDNIQQK